MLDAPKGLTMAAAEKPRMVNVKMRIASMAIFTSYDFNFLAQVLRRSADHQAGNKNRENYEHDGAVQAGTDSPETTSPSMMLINGTIPPSGVNESC